MTFPSRHYPIPSHLKKRSAAERSLGKPFSLLQGRRGQHGWSAGSTSTALPRAPCRSSAMVPGGQSARPTLMTEMLALPAASSASAPGSGNPRSLPSDALTQTRYAALTCRACPANVTEHLCGGLRHQCPGLANPLREQRGFSTGVPSSDATIPCSYIKDCTRLAAYSIVILS